MTAREAKHRIAAWGRICERELRMADRCRAGRPAKRFYLACAAVSSQRAFDAARELREVQS